MFKPSATRKPVIYDANPIDYHAPQKAQRGSREYVMSRSELEAFAGCARKWFKGIPRDVTKAITWGDVVDVIALTPKNVEQKIAVTPEFYESEGMECPKCKSVTDSQKCAKCKVDRVKKMIKKPWSPQSDTCQEWVEKQRKEGKTVVGPDLISDAWKAHARLREDEDCSKILDASKKQVQVNVDWHDKDTGLIVPFKCLIDLLPDPKSEFGDTIWDLKTTKSAAHKSWQRQVFNDNLFYQAGIYLPAVNAATGLKYRNFGHLLSESDAPFEPAHRLMTDEFLQLGINDAARDMERYCRCLKSGNWPGYDNDPVDVENWMIKI